MKHLRILVFLFVIVPFYSNAQVEKGNALFEDFHYSKAVKYYQKDVTSTDQRVAFMATKMLAECYIKMNNLKETIHWLTELERFEEGKPDVHFKLGEAYRKSGRYLEAYDQFQKFNELEPNAASLAYESYCKNIELLELNPRTKIESVTTINTEKSEFCPFPFGEDLLFTTDRNSKIDGTYGWTNFGFCKTFVASQANPFDVFTFPKRPLFMKSKQINQSLHSGPLTISGNKKTYFLTRTESSNFRGKKDNGTIFLSLEYGSVVGDNFKAGKSFPFNNQFYNVGHAALSYDGKTVIYSSDSPDGYGQGDLYISHSKRGVWSEPENLGPVLNGFGDEVFPFLLNDSTLYFSSTTHFGYGGLDCFVSHKRNDEWSKPMNLGAPINSSYDDFGVYLLEDGEQGYITSDREGGMGSDDIYAFRMGRQSKKKEPIVLAPREVAPKSSFTNISKASPQPVASLKGGNFTGLVLDEITNEPIMDALVFVLHPSTRDVNVYSTNSKGMFTAEAKEKELLVMHALKENCTECYYQFKVPTSNEWDHKLPEVLYMREGGIKPTIYKKSVYFDSAKDNLRSDSRRTLDHVIEYIKKIEGDYKVYLDSHTDIRASSEYNKDLSWRRAQQTMKYLVDNGISSRNITIDWHGETQPKVGTRSSTSISERMHSENRRTEISIEHISKKEYSVSIDPNLYEAGDVLPMEIFPALFFNTSQAAQRQSIDD